MLSWIRRTLTETGECYQQTCKRFSIEGEEVVVGARIVFLRTCLRKRMTTLYISETMITMKASRPKESQRIVLVAFASHIRDKPITAGLQACILGNGSRGVCLCRRQILCQVDTGIIWWPILAYDGLSGPD